MSLHRFSDLESIDDNNRESLSRSENSRRQGYRGKPSFLRFVAKKCGYFSKTCRDIVENQAVSSSIPPSSIVSHPVTRNDRYTEAVLEALFNEGLSKRENNDFPAQPKNLREMASAKLTIDEMDISMLERYKKSSPFVFISTEAVCVVCKKRLCCREACLAYYGCKGCTQRIYCSEICFSLDWPHHIRFCIPGQADFLLQFLINRLRCKCNLNLQLQNVVSQGTYQLGRGAAVIVFEHLEALKDFTLEYYYSLQYISIREIQDKFHRLESYNLIISFIKSYNIFNQSVVFIVVKNSILPTEIYEPQPFCDIGIIPLCKSKYQKDHKEIFCPRDNLNSLISSSRWDFKARRKISLTIRRICNCFKHGSRGEEFLQEALNHYFLTGRLKPEIIENCLFSQKICNIDDNQELDHSTLTSLV